MKTTIRKFICSLLLSLPLLAGAQIQSLFEEQLTRSKLNELLSQSYTEYFFEKDEEDATCQRMRLDSTGTLIEFFKTACDTSELHRLNSKQGWLGYAEIPVLDIARFKGDDKKQTITIVLKKGRKSVQWFMQVPGGEFGGAARETELVYHSDKLFKVRNLEARLNAAIAELQAFQQKKDDLLQLLNNALKKELTYQLNPDYPDDNKFSIVQEFQINSNHVLSVVVKKNDWTEKQEVHLSQLIEVAKDINVILIAKHGAVRVTRIQNGKESSEDSGDLFFLHQCFEKNNEAAGEKIVKAFQSLGIALEKTVWYD